MGEMQDMAGMPGPANTLPMMMGNGPEVLAHGLRQRVDAARDGRRPHAVGRARSEVGDFPRHARAKASSCNEEDRRESRARG